MTKNPNSPWFLGFEKFTKGENWDNLRRLLTGTHPNPISPHRQFFSQHGYPDNQTTGAARTNWRSNWGYPEHMKNLSSSAPCFGGLNHMGKLLYWYSPPTKGKQIPVDMVKDVLLWRKSAFWPIMEAIIEDYFKDFPDEDSIASFISVWGMPVGPTALAEFQAEHIIGFMFLWRDMWEMEEHFTPAYQHLRSLFPQEEAKAFCIAITSIYSKKIDMRNQIVPGPLWYSSFRESSLFNRGYPAQFFGWSLGKSMNKMNKGPMGVEPKWATSGSAIWNMFSESDKTFEIKFREWTQARSADKGTLQKAKSAYEGPYYDYLIPIDKYDGLLIELWKVVEKALGNRNKKSNKEAA